MSYDHQPNKFKYNSSRIGSPTCRDGGLVAEGVVALLAECSFVDGVLDEAGLQHLRRRLARLAPVGEPLDLSSLRVIDLGRSISLTFTDLFIEPVDDVAADEGVLDGDLEPQPVAHLQSRVCEGISFEQMNKRRFGLVKECRKCVSKTYEI